MEKIATLFSPQNGGGTGVPRGAGVHWRLRGSVSSATRLFDGGVDGAGSAKSRQRGMAPRRDRERGAARAGAPGHDTVDGCPDVNAADNRCNANWFPKSSRGGGISTIDQGAILRSLKSSGGSRTGGRSGNGLGSRTSSGRRGDVKGLLGDVRGLSGDIGVNDALSIDMMKRRVEGLTAEAIQL